MNKPIVLCGDDYGQADEISNAILPLIEQGRLSATSCMVNRAHWSQHASLLLPFRGQIDIGLHLNLTTGQALSQSFIHTYGPTFFPLSTLLCKACLHKIDQAVIEAEFHAQIDSFIAAFGGLPDFIDGHQHIHQFPVIRKALINVYEARMRKKKVYVRLLNHKVTSTLLDFTHDIKKMVIYTMGTKALNALLHAHNIPHNLSCSGIYSFSKGNYQALFPRFLRECGTGGLIMCHPSLAVPFVNDVMAKARYEEYQYLKSNQFLKACRDQGVVIKRFSH